MMGGALARPPFFLILCPMVSDWENQIKAQIKRRYSRQIKNKGLGYKNPKELGYPVNLIDNLPPILETQYSGCGYLFDNIYFDGTEMVLDLGSGIGLDSYIASTFISTGKVFSLDMTYEVLSDHNTHKINPICADMEYLPIENCCVNIILANASFNLSLNKERAFNEAYRVLKNSGRLIMRDIIKVEELPQEILIDPLSFNTSLGGAIDELSLKSKLGKAGFVDIIVSDRQAFSYVESVKIEAIKPSNLPGFPIQRNNEL